MNPVLPADVQGPPVAPPSAPVPIGPRDTQLGNQALPSSPIQLLPPMTDISTPQPVPVLVPLLVPCSAPATVVSTDSVVAPAASKVEQERLEELMARLSVSTDAELLKTTLDKFENTLDKYDCILTVCWTFIDYFTLTCTLLKKVKNNFVYKLLQFIRYLYFYYAP